MRGRAGGGEVGEDFADRGRELEAVPGAGRGDHDLRRAGQPIDDEIAVGRHRVEAGLGLEQAPVRGRQVLGDGGPAGEIDAGAISQPVKAPANVFPQFGGLEIETSSTQLQELTDAVIYLTSYPYECSEQLSSRIITIAALRDVLRAFKAKEMPSAEEMEAAVTRDLKRLQGMQNSDGGFGFWTRGDESWPYLSIHVAHALARAKQKKFDVPQEMFEKSRKYLREIESHIPSYYGIDARRAIIYERRANKKAGGWPAG